MSTLTGDLTQLSVTEPTTTTITIQTAQRHKESVDSISYEITVSGGYTTDSSLVHRQVAGAVTAQRRRQTVNTWRIVIQQAVEIVQLASAGSWRRRVAVGGGGGETTSKNIQYSQSAHNLKID